MTERQYKIALVVAIVLAALAIIWAATRSAYAASELTPAQRLALRYAANHPPECIPAYVRDPRNAVGGQMFSLTFLPMFLIVGVPVAVDKQEVLPGITQAKAFCTVAAVALHGVALVYEPKDSK